MRTLPYWALAALASAAFAQDPAPETPPPVEPVPVVAPPLPVGAGQPQGGAQEEMIRLFQQVETRLAEIDDLLFDASAGTPIGAQEESGIGDLLQRSIAGSEEVRTSIDRILELAEQAGPNSQSQSSGSPQSEGSPLDSQPGGQQGQKEQTPEGPAGQPEGAQSQPMQEQPGGQGQAQDPRDSLEDPRNRPAGDPQGGETGSKSGAQGAERWGDLPTHVRDLFRTEGGGDMPPQYRDWIDAYYRRLNQRP